ncbi:MAG: hypothetical protein H8D67_02135, partial [Deltaproteobacteria bacterium]|nr:hypothetical protein [Deltaproteobacteria bacterium]
MTQSRDEQRAILLELLDDPRLLGSAKNQVRVFLELLGGDDSIGFDTTSALFYGFLNNPDFAHHSGCSLSRQELAEAKTYFRQCARIPRAHESALLKKISRLPL